MALYDKSKPLPNERVVYEVSPGQIESAILITSGPNRGKYQDEKDPSQLFDSSQDWIRSKNSRIPAGIGAS